MFFTSQLLSNIATNFKALVAFGYFSENELLSALMPVGTLLIVIFYTAAMTRNLASILLLTASLFLSLTVTAFIGIGPGSVVSGRLLYTSSLILSILIACGITNLVNFSSKPWQRTLGFVSFCALLAIQQVSMRSFSLRFTEATGIARNIMWQVFPFSEHPFVHIRNLPRFLYEGPHIMKCYMFPIYFRQAFGKSARFRCDQVNLVSYSNGYREIDSRVHDQYSEYSEPRADEKSVELAFISWRNCAKSNLRDCIVKLRNNKHPVFSIAHGCPEVNDILYSTNLNEVQMLVFSGSWTKACKSLGFELANLILYSTGSHLENRAPLYRCAAEGYHFVSLDTKCQGKNFEALLGYISKNPEEQATTKMIGCFDKNGWRPNFGNSCPNQTQEEILGYVELSDRLDLKTIN
jgi:hypothetical protein